MLACVQKIPIECKNADLSAQNAGLCAQHAILFAQNTNLCGKMLIYLHKC